MTDDLEGTDHGAEVKLRFSMRDLAHVFCQWDDDAQAKFFVAVADIMEAWGPGKLDGQAWYIGGHLRNCKCSTEAARELIRSLAHGLEKSEHGKEPA